MTYITENEAMRRLLSKDNVAVSDEFSKDKTRTIRVVSLKLDTSKYLNHFLARNKELSLVTSDK